MQTQGLKSTCSPQPFLLLQPAAPAGPGLQGPPPSAKLGHARPHSPSQPLQTQGPALPHPHACPLLGRSPQMTWPGPTPAHYPPEPKGGTRGCTRRRQARRCWHLLPREPWAKGGCKRTHPHGRPWGGVPRAVPLGEGESGWQWPPRKGGPTRRGGVSSLRHMAGPLHTLGMCLTPRSWAPRDGHLEMAIETDLPVSPGLEASCPRFLARGISSSGGWVLGDGVHTSCPLVLPS